MPFIGMVKAITLCRTHGRLEYAESMDKTGCYDAALAVSFSSAITCCWPGAVCREHLSILTANSINSCAVSSERRETMSAKCLQVLPQDFLSTVKLWILGSRSARMLWKGSTYGLFSQKTYCNIRMSCFQLV